MFGCTAAASSRREEGRLYLLDIGDRANSIRRKGGILGPHWMALWRKCPVKAGRAISKSHWLGCKTRERGGKWSAHSPLNGPFVLQRRQCPCPICQRNREGYMKAIVRKEEKDEEWRMMKCREEKEKKWSNCWLAMDSIVRLTRAGYSVMIRSIHLKCIYNIPWLPCALSSFSHSTHSIHIPHSKFGFFVHILPIRHYRF
jgi:hypothetical protein